MVRSAMERLALLTEDDMIPLLNGLCHAMDTYEGNRVDPLTDEEYAKIWDVWNKLANGVIS